MYETGHSFDLKEQVALSPRTLYAQEWASHLALVRHSDCLRLI
jgi:hypothetical protein